MTSTWSEDELTTIQSEDEVVLAELCRDVVPPLPMTSRVHRWSAPDGLEVEGWLHLPPGEGPHPLVVFVHGGPVLSWCSHWNALAVLRAWLVERGYALLLPNPRGSAGRGQEFARASTVIGRQPNREAFPLHSKAGALTGTCPR